MSSHTKDMTGRCAACIEQGCAHDGCHEADGFTENIVARQAFDHPVLGELIRAKGFDTFESFQAPLSEFTAERRKAEEAAKAKEDDRLCACGATATSWQDGKGQCPECLIKEVG